MIAYCDEKKIPVQASAKKPYSMDRNLLHISFEAGILEDPWMDAFAPKNKDMFKLSVSPEDAPGQARICDARFREGQLRRRQRQGPEPAGRDASAEQARAANTASAAWTWWRTATWA